MRRFGRVFLALTVAGLASWPHATPAQTTKAGVVTLLEGQATAARTALPQPVPLKFKDDVFLDDQIVTGDQSLVRLLLGGRAAVTVRERSSLKITEVPGRSIIDMTSGKIAVAVSKDRMRPGDTIQIRTPNAVAAVRGTVFIVEVSQATAQVGTGSAAVTTNIYGFGGSVDVDFGGPPTTLTPGMFASRIGLAPPTIGVMTDVQRAQAVRGLRASAQNMGGGQQSAKAQAVDATTATLDAFVPGTAPPAVTPPAIVTSAPKADLLPGGEATLPPSVTEPPVAPPPTRGVLTNGGFETGDLTGWTLSGTGGVIPHLGSITPPEGSYMAILTTRGTVPSGEPNRLVSGRVPSGHIFLVSAQYNFLSNEFPTHGSSFDDTLRIKVVDSEGVTTTLATESRNTSFTSSTVSPETATASGLTPSGSSFTINAGNGVTGFRTLESTVVSTGDGLDSVMFEIFNVNDASVDSAVLVDAVVVALDPPRYFLRNGEQLIRTTAAPLLSLSGETQTFDSLMVVCCQASATLGGPLLEARDSTLTVPFSLVSVVQGGRVSSSSPAPLVSLNGGRYTLGSMVGMFDVSGVATAEDGDGLVVGTDRPLSFGGSLVEATGATVETRRLLKIDTALLEATAPLLALAGGSAMSTAGHTVDLVGRAKVSLSGDGIAMMSLDASSLTVNGANLVNVAGGSVLTLDGDLVRLSGGSTLTVRNGVLLSADGGSTVTIGGALARFTGTGNTISVTNNLRPTAVIRGIPVYAPNGDVRIARNVLAGLGTAGSVRINGVELTPTTRRGSLTGSLIAVGGNSRVTIGR